jgi:hypothetical protein
MPGSFSRSFLKTGRRSLIFRSGQVPGTSQRTSGIGGLPGVILQRPQDERTLSPSRVILCLPLHGRRSICSLLGLTYRRKALFQFRRVN